MQLVLFMPLLVEVSHSRGSVEVGVPIYLFIGYSTAFY